MSAEFLAKWIEGEPHIFNWLLRINAFNDDGVEVNIRDLEKIDSVGAAYALVDKALDEAEKSRGNLVEQTSDESTTKRDNRMVLATLRPIGQRLAELCGIETPTRNDWEEWDRFVDRCLKQAELQYEPTNEQKAKMGIPGYTRDPRG